MHRLRLVEVIVDGVVESKCYLTWQVDESTATADSEEWAFNCTQHDTRFMMWQGCPHSHRSYDAGATLSLPVEEAESLVKAGIAAYPTHRPAIEESIAATLSRTNELMDSMGLPHLDEESLRTVKVRGKKGSSHYRPADRKLAGDLGLSAEDIADMRSAI